MSPTFDSLAKYLGNTLGVSVTLNLWTGATALPPFLRQTYEFACAEIAGAQVLFLCAASEPTPGIAQKHLSAVGAYWVGPMAFAFPRITPRGRQRLIAAGIQFVVPGNQMFLPSAGLDLRERFRRPSATRRETLRPSAQALFLALLLDRLAPGTTLAAAAGLLGYTPAAIGQAVEQLETAGLVCVARAGRERRLNLVGDRASAWTNALPLLTTPLKRTHCLAGVPMPDAAPLADISALAEYSMLSEPRVPVVAADLHTARALLASPSADELPSEDGADFCLEVWSYDPLILAAPATVDRLSLYLSLRHDTDERVGTALREMMGGFTWLEDWVCSESGFSDSRTATS